MTAGTLERPSDRRAPTWQMRLRTRRGNGVVLPSGPTDREKYLFVKRNQLVIVVFSLASMTGLLLSQIRFAGQSPILWWFYPLIAATLVYYLIALAVASPVTKDFDLGRHRELTTGWRPGRYPSVDIFLPVCGEPIEVIANAWRHVARLRYQGVITVYCLDDGADPSLEALCAAFGFRYLSRPNRGEMKKAGNLKYGWERSDGDLILVFDADFCPREDMLLETVPYFDADPRLGILQTPQHFRVGARQTWLERGAGSVQEWFYRVVQVSRNNHEGSICVGTNALYRRAALDSIGGPTQIGHSEDVHTGFDVRRAGWDMQYIPIIFAIGMCPDRMPAFLAQQYRWCMGSMSLLGSAKFWRTGLGNIERLSYISGFSYYVYTAIFTFVLPLIPLVLLLCLPELVLLENYVLLVPSVVYNFVVLPAWHHHPYGADALATKMTYGWAHAFAITDLLRGRVEGWQPTGSQSGASALSRRFQWGIVVWGGGTAVLWVMAAVWRMWSHEPVDFLPMLVSGLVYAQLVGRCLGAAMAREDLTRKALAITAISVGDGRPQAHPEVAPETTVAA